MRHQAFVTVPTAGGTQTVPVIAQRGVWAVTPTLDALLSEPDYTITHVPTGLRVCHGLSLAEARRALRRLPLRWLAHAEPWPPGSPPSRSDCDDIPGATELAAVIAAVQAGAR